MFIPVQAHGAIDSTLSSELVRSKELRGHGPNAITRPCLMSTHARSIAAPAPTPDGHPDRDLPLSRDAVAKLIPLAQPHDAFADFPPHGRNPTLSSSLFLSPTFPHTESYPDPLHYFPSPKTALLHRRDPPSAQQTNVVVAVVTTVCLVVFIAGSILFCYFFGRPYRYEMRRRRRRRAKRRRASKVVAEKVVEVPAPAEGEGEGAKE